MTTPSWTEDYLTDDLVCDRCQDMFDDEHDFKEHLSKSYYHSYCERELTRLMLQYTRVVPAHVSPLATGCDLDFDNQQSLEEHSYHSSAHNVCDLCSIDFEYVGGLDCHLRSEHWSCSMCGTAFSNENLLLNHQTSSHPYCATHRRAFRNYHDLNQHLNSSAHLPSNIVCPAGCGRRFINFGAVTLHLEAGTCSSGINRVQIDNQVAQFDRQNLITNNTNTSGPPSRRITSGASSNNRYSPYSNNRSSPVVSNLATNASWNPSTQSFECFFCHSLFSSLPALNQHLSSPRHQYETFRQLPTNKLLYKCPNSNCTRNFLALSGLVQHVEFGSCGVRQFRGVMNTIENVMGGMRRIGN
ncbi:hypothetical protein JCM3765_007485 [Sporobolomyces pararoseus]